MEIAPRALSNDRAHNEPNKAAGRVKDAAHWAFWICVGLAALFAFIFVLGILANFVGNVDRATIFVSERFLPVATREFLLWFADDVLPQPAPAIKWANAFGATWNGLLTFISFVLAVLSIILVGTELKGASAFFRSA